MNNTNDNLAALVANLLKQPHETPWLELKHDNYDPGMIGEDICALANSAVLSDKPRAYMLWGVDDKTHEIVGTNNDLQTITLGGKQELENWLRSMLSNNADFTFGRVVIDDLPVGVIAICGAVGRPVTFQRVGYVRVGSYTKKLSDHPALEARLWEKLRNSRFEERGARKDLALEEAVRLLDCSAYFNIMDNIPQPRDIDGVAHYMLEDGVLARQDDGLYAITNLGALLLAKRLSEFPKVARKAVRVAQYRGDGRLNMLKDETFNRGYLLCIEALVKFIEALTPSSEDIPEALREKKTAYPTLAVRESIANALIHQDFTVTGTGPVVEVFDRRIEITNSGTPLVAVEPTRSSRPSPGA